MFFMYTMSSNKHFLPIFYKKSKNIKKYVNLNKYYLIDYSLNSFFNCLKKKPNNKYYISKIYLCKYTNWIFVYLYIYSITNIQAKFLKKKFKIGYYNYSQLYSVYLYNKQKYII